MQLSASSAALDLALSQNPVPETQSNGWTPFARHQASRQSLPQNVFDIHQPNQQSLDSPNSSSQLSIDTTADSDSSARQPNRHSMEASIASYAQKNMLAQTITNGTSSMRPNLANIQSSYSTNDIPTLKNPNGLTTPISPPKTQAQQQFHNHNASLGRIPPHAVSSRHSREMSVGEIRREEQNNNYKVVHSELQASAAPFGPSMSTPAPVESMPANAALSNVSQYASPAYYGGYGMQLINMGMTPIHMNNQLGFNNQVSPYQPQSSFLPYSQYGQQGRMPDSQARVIQQRRMQNVEGTTPNLPRKRRHKTDNGSRCCALHKHKIRTVPGRDLCAL